MITLATISFLTNVVFGFIEFLVGFRILLRLFGASSKAPFANWVYETSRPLLSPFVGMFPSPRLTGGFVVEFSALFGLLVYAFIAYGVTELIKYLEQTAEKAEKRKRG